VVVDKKLPVLSLYLPDKLPTLQASRLVASPVLSSSLYFNLKIPENINIWVEYQQLKDNYLCLEG
jgi:hypothetical protein